MNVKRSSKREKRGVSPVLATMIMIGVAVTVGLGVASYTMGLFGNLSKSAQLSLVSVDVRGTGDDEDVTFTIDNKGSSAAKLNRVETIIGSTVYYVDRNDSIGASSQQTITIDDGEWKDASNNNKKDPAFEEGKTYTFTLKFSDGKILTATATAR